MIDFLSLLTLQKEEICLDGTYEIPSRYWEGTDILDLSSISVSGSLTRKDQEEIFLVMSISGKMKLKDSVTLEPVWYPFSFSIEEKLEEFVQNHENTLDIIEVLWQNIVLEVPLRYTVTEDYRTYQGDGWKLVSEEEFNHNNPFSALLEEKDRSD